MASEATGWFRNHLLDWATDTLRDYPWRKPDASPYEVFVAEFLLMRTQADSVEPVYNKLLDEYPSVESLESADEDDLADLLEPLGLHNKRADGLTTIASRVDEQGLPDAEADLLDLPYVGEYVANATLCFGFEQNRPIVDANVYRVYSRFFGEKRFDGPDDGSLWDFAEDILPSDHEDVRKYNLALLDFGSLVCKPNSPDCEECPMRERCDYYQSV